MEEELEKYKTTAANYKAEDKEIKNRIAEIKT